MAPRKYPGVSRLWYVDRNGVRRQTETWFIKYSYRGKRHREKTGKTSQREAYEILLQRKQEIRTGRLIGPSAERVTVEILEQLVATSYVARGRRTPVSTITRRFGPMRGYFAMAKAMDITAADLSAYVVSRRGEGAALATIQVELAHLQRGFSIAVKSKLLPEAPQFPILKVENARRVFIDRQALALLLEHLHPDVRPVFEVGLLTGWRKEALLSRQRLHVDLRNRWVTLDGRWSKNGEPVQVPLNRPLRTIFVLQERRARQLERKTGRIIPWCFFYSTGPHAGQRVKDVDHAFDRARELAGIPHVQFHDLRRGAVRLLKRAGASEHEIMEWVGMKTRAMFDRYDIIDEERRRETGAMQETYYEEEGRKRPVVAAFRRKS